MHALLENAVTYSYDNSKVVVSGTVRRATPAPPASPITGETAVVPPEPVEAVFTPATLEPEPVPPENTWSGPASSTTAPGAQAGDLSGVTGADGSDGAAEERDTVRLSVQDHGYGIPARDLERIFERFYRVDHGRSRDTGGTGLGLSIVRHVANNHRGWVDVESREGDGSTFSLVLPLQAERVV
jgi:signal transduction histidine kinase